MSLVFFDTETAGLKDTHPTIQLAAIAVDSGWNVLESFNMKIKFNEADADPEALRMNHYDSGIWAEEAKPEPVVVAAFDSFLQSYKSVEMVSKRTGRPYTVARLAGHNVVTFDMPRLKRMYGERFMPAHPAELDTYQLAMWYFYDKGDGHAPVDLKLQTLAGWFGIEAGDAHDALADVRISIAVAKKLHGRMA